MRRLIKDGAHVVIADISAEAGTALAVELGPHAAFVSCDVRREHSASLGQMRCNLGANQKAEGCSDEVF